MLVGAVVPLGGAVVPLRDGDFAREREFSRFWAEKRPENGQIEGANNGIRLSERRGSKINKYSNRSTDQNLQKRTRFADRFKSNLGLFFVEIFEFLKIKEKFGGFVGETKSNPWQPLL